MNDILSVSELTFAIKNLLESRFTHVQVQGEISNFKEQASGHFYFTLKDANSQVSAVLFKGSAKNVSRLPKGGEQVIIKGEISLYAPRGSYQIVVRELQYLGVGELLLKLHDLKIKLEKKGYFDLQRKKSLPKYPKTIGVVTSPTGSVIQDILHILNRRLVHYHLILNPVKVQGEGAAKEIAQAIGDFNKYGLADVLIVGRGGGSLEDLWPFNEEVVAEAIFASKIPIISAVGHETDFCIADYVADLRAPTPSAAAEIVSQEKVQKMQTLLTAEKRLKSFAEASIREGKNRMKSILRHPLFASPFSILEKYYQMIDDVKEDFVTSSRKSIDQKKLRLFALQKQAHALNPSRLIQGAKQKFAHYEKNIYYSLSQKVQNKKSQVTPLPLYKTLTRNVVAEIAKKREKLTRLVNHLQAIDPRNLLTKGYCILFSENKESVILSAEELHAEQKVRILIHDGDIGATINEVKK